MHRLATPATNLLVCLLFPACGLFIVPTDEGELLMASGRYSEAIQALRSTPKSPKKDRLLARAFRSRAATSLRREQCESALSDLEIAAKLEARVKIDYQQADRCFTQKEQPPPLPLARFLYETGDSRTRILDVLLNQAVSDRVFKEANQLARTLAARNIWRHQHAQWLAKASFQHGALSDAQFWLIKLVTKDPKNAYLLTRLAITCSKLNDTQLAHLYFGKAWALSPGNPVLVREWRTVCERRNDNRCIEMLRARTITPPDDRKLRPLLKSKR